LFSRDATSSTNGNKVTMAVKIMVVATVDVAAIRAHWELVAVAHIVCLYVISLFLYYSGPPTAMNVVLAIIADGG